MDSGTEQKSWRNSPWTAVIGIPVFLLLICVLVFVPCSQRQVGETRAYNCRSKLKQLVIEKGFWAEAGNKSTNDIPTDADLFGPDKPSPRKPPCPAGGTYTLGSVGTKPRCSIPGHTL